MRYWKTISISIVSAIALGACTEAADLGDVSEGLNGGPATVGVQLLAVNDFHGNLEPPEGANALVTTGFNGNTPITVSAGGAAYLATHIAALRATNDNTLFISAGDLVGASPLVSALFHDEGTIEAFNAMGLDYNATGNHEFDEGPAELTRLQEGGCHPLDGCLDGDGFAGSTARFLSANVIRENDHSLFPAYKVRSFAGARIGIIGVTLRDTPTIVSPAGVAGLQFADEIATVNSIVATQQALGVHTFVVAIHQGGAQSGLQSGQYNDCKGLNGPIVDLANGFDPAVGVVLSAHTHNAYNCRLNGRIVTSAASFGRLITRVQLTLDRETGELVDSSAENVIVTRTVAQDPAVKAIVDKYVALSAPLANRVIGSITADIRRVYRADGTTRDDSRESPLGDVIADAQLASTADPARGGAVVAFMNPGGIRADFTYASSSAGEGDGNVTYKEAFTVQPFANVLATVTMTGAQIDTVLEQQALVNRRLQVSHGFTYTYAASAPIGNRIDPSTIKLDGVTLDPAGSYRVTINGFLADGGDGFSGFLAGTDRLGGDVDIDALVEYFGNSSPIAPGPADRVTVIP